MYVGSVPPAALNPFENLLAMLPRSARGANSPAAKFARVLITPKTSIRGNVYTSFNFSHTCLSFDFTHDNSLFKVFWSLEPFFKKGSSGGQGQSPSFSSLYKKIAGVCRSDIRPPFTPVRALCCPIISRKAVYAAFGTLFWPGRRSIRGFTAPSVRLPSGQVNRKGGGRSANHLVNRSPLI